MASGLGYLSTGPATTCSGTAQLPCRSAGAETSPFAGSLATADVFLHPQTDRSATLSAEAAHKRRLILRQRGEPHERDDQAIKLAKGEAKEALSEALRVPGRAVLRSEPSPAARSRGCATTRSSRPAVSLGMV